MRHDHARACEEKLLEWIEKEWGKFGHHPSTSFKALAAQAYEAGWVAGCEFLLADLDLSGKSRTGELIARIGENQKARPAVSNIKPITGGPLGDPNVVSSLLTAAKGEPDAPTEAAPHRVDGVADLLACRLQTGEPRFHPERPVTINGFLYKPVDVPTEGKE